MPKFLWKGIDVAGNQVKGNVFADNQEVLRNQLLNNGVALLSCSILDKKKWQISRRLSQYDFINFFDQMGMLLDGGVDLLSAIKTVEQQEQNNKLRDILGCIRVDLQNGNSLAVALSKHKKIFNDFITQMIEVGLRSGQLSFVLAQISLHIKKDQQLRKDLYSAALMPIVTVFFALLIVVVILIVVVSQFEVFFSSIGKQLPTATRRIIWVSKFLRSWRGAAALIALVLGFFGGIILLGKNRVKQFKDWLFISIPYVKNLVELSNFTHFLQALTVLLKSGIPLKEAVICSRDSMNNSYLRCNVNAAIDNITRGRMLSDSIALLPSFYRQATLVALINVGEQTGALADVLGSATESFQEELRRFVLILTTLFQPVLLITVGLITGILIWMIYLPIFNLAYSIG
ncbi:MAG: type II secretion system F family protein [bacterium]